MGPEYDEVELSCSIARRRWLYRGKRSEAHKQPNKRRQEITWGIGPLLEIVALGKGKLRAMVQFEIK